MGFSEKKICGAALVFVIIGLVALEMASFSEMTVTEFTAVTPGTTVVLRGVATDVEHRQNRTQFTLVTECEIPVVLFEKASIPEKVLVKGTKENYKGEEQIIAREII